MGSVTFSLMTKPQILGVLKATGSTDRDVLFAAKEELLGQVRPLKIFGIWAYVTGGLCCLLILLAIIGVPLLFFGWWVRRRAKQNIELIEVTFAEYVNSVSGLAAAIA
jgi:hypothetical protein